MRILRDHRLEVLQCLRGRDAGQINRAERRTIDSNRDQRRERLLPGGRVDVRNATSEGDAVDLPSRSDSQTSCSVLRTMFSTTDEYRSRCSFSICGDSAISSFAFTYLYWRTVGRSAGCGKVRLTRSSRDS